MSDYDKDELIESQKQVIGILFEIIKRYQANSLLDEEYFEIISAKTTKDSTARLEKILEERKQNSEIVNRLLQQFDS